MAALNKSVVFDPTTGFGGFGRDCVTDEPFVNLTLHLTADSMNSSYCLSRSFNSRGFQSGVQANIDECFNMGTYDEAFECYQVNPPHCRPLCCRWHRKWKICFWNCSGLTADTWQMLDVVCSPGEPLFFLHHTNLDRLWREWQQASLMTRLAEIGGRNIPLTSYLAQNGMSYPGASVLGYDGDDGNVTTLNHNLWIVGSVPNATIGEVMDLGSGLVCAEYCLKSASGMDNYDSISLQRG